MEIEHKESHLLEKSMNKYEIELSFWSSHPIWHILNVESRDKIERSVICQNDRDHISFWKALIDVSKRFVPSSISFLIEYGIMAINIIFISFLDDPILMSGCGLGSATVNLIVFSIWAGFWGGIDTLVSQAFGRKDYYLCGVYLNTARIVTIGLNVIQTLVLINSETIFILIGQQPEAAAIAHSYIMSVLPGLFMNTQFEWLRRFLLVQGIYNAIMYILAATIWIHVLLLYSLILVLDLKIVGVGIATAITYCLNLTFLTLYIHFKKNLIDRRSWHWFDINWIYKLTAYLKYAIPACSMIVIEWWAFEILILFSGYCGIKQLAALTIMLSVNTILFMFSLGISYSWTSLVGNSLGANLPNIARTYAKAWLIFGWGLFGIIIILLSIFMRKIVSLYSTDEEVIEQIMATGVVWILGLVGDMTQGFLGGTIRAMGYQTVATITGIIAYWFLMVPTSYIFGIVLAIGNKGVWLGVPVGASLQMLAYLYIVFTVSWKKLAEEASSHENITKEAILRELD